MNTVIIFFSRADENYFGGAMKFVETGNTEIAVGHIKELTGFDSFKLEMVKPYSAKYMICIDEAKVHLRENARPELKEIPDVSGYDNIILAYPNYWGTAPMAVFTFLDSADLSGKTIYPLCTNEGSGLGKSVSDIRKYADVGEGLSLSGSGVKNSKPVIEKWLKNNHII
ncbi:MAG: flavodoxin [Oscillospiraceae bacterium]|nr:flavodoxin [Oscillospiraceae bacterium]